MKKITGIIRQDSAVGFHRIVQPLRFMKRNNLVKDARMTNFSGDNVYGEYQGKLNFPEDMMKTILEGTDIIWSNYTNSKSEMLRMLDYRKYTGAKLIIDIDDNIYAASEDNYVKVSKTTTDLIELSLKIADGITVSVPSLKELYSPLNKNIYIKPNGVDLKLWRRNHVPHEGIRIGWEGAYGHRHDLELVYPAMRQLIKDYGVTFVVFGCSPKEGIQAPDFPIEWHTWVGLKSYPKALAKLGLDIAVAPLIDSSYNRCKSNLRILDFASLGIPVVASPTENQKNMPILYADSNYEWYNELEKLINNKVRRKQSSEQTEFIKENYDESNLVKYLVEWMDILPRRTDLEL